MLSTRTQAHSARVLESPRPPRTKTRARPPSRSSKAGAKRVALARGALTWIERRRWFAGDGCRRKRAHGRPQARRHCRDSWARRALHCALCSARGPRNARADRDKCALASAAPARGRVLEPPPSPHESDSRTSLCCSVRRQLRAPCGTTFTQVAPPSANPAPSCLTQALLAARRKRYVSVARSHGYLGCCLSFIIYFSQNHFRSCSSTLGA